MKPDNAWQQEHTTFKLMIRPVIGGY